MKDLKEKLTTALKESFGLGAIEPALIDAASRSKHASELSDGAHKIEMSHLHNIKGGEHGFGSTVRNAHMNAHHAHKDASYAHQTEARSKFGRLLDMEHENEMNKNIKKSYLEDLENEINTHRDKAKEHAYEAGSHKRKSEEY